LKRRWEQALQAEWQVRDDYDRFLREQPPQLSQDERAQIAALSADLPALWHAPGTTHRDRKEIVRRLVDKVVVPLERDTNIWASRSACKACARHTRLVSHRSPRSTRDVESASERGGAV
jgi:hypothetical protein